MKGKRLNIHNDDFNKFSYKEMGKDEGITRRTDRYNADTDGENRRHSETSKTSEPFGVNMSSNAHWIGIDNSCRRQLPEKSFYSKSIASIKPLLQTDVNVDCTRSYIIMYTRTLNIIYIIHNTYMYIYTYYIV